MRKKVLVISIFIFCLIFTGCTKNNTKDIISKIEKNLENTNGYSLVGVLEIMNNEDTYTYDVNVAFSKDDKFRVSLKNQINNHEQVILRNEDGVYVLTPSLNKSFKFQSEWPYNNSQSYLLQTILKDIKNDEERIFEEENGNYIYIVKAHYSNNQNLVKQKIIFDNNLNLKEVLVMNDKDQTLMKMSITNINMNENYTNNYFTLKENMETYNEIDQEDTVSKIEEVIYPMYMPVNTYLASQDQVDKEIGERIILTFSGEKPFMLVQETVSKESEMTITPMYGEPDIIGGTIGAVSDNSITWFSEGIEYYLVSDALSKEELVSVAKSISVMPVVK